MMPTTESLVRVGRVTFGRGVFALKSIKNGLPLGEVTGRVIDDPNYATSYCIDLGGSFSLEPRAPFRYLNHCCTPNCRLVLTECEYEDGSPAPAEVHVEAIADIEEGAELTIDYAWSAEGAIPCLCGSHACRGWVVDQDELSKVRRSSRRTSTPVPKSPPARMPRKPR
jgi:uncharacterized protein